MKKFRNDNLCKKIKFTFISILVLLALSSCFFGIYINKVYGNISDYFDIYLHPQKQSYNLFFASSMVKYDYKFYNEGKDTIYTLIRQENEKYKGQKSLKSKVILKYIDLFYDLYRAIGSADYYNIQPVKINKEDLKNVASDKNVIESIISLNSITPKLETDNELKEILKEKNEALLAFSQNYKKDIKRVSIQFFDPTTQDEFFAGIEDLQTNNSNGNINSRPCKNINKTSTPDEVLDMINCETDNSRDTLYDQAKDLRKQYIIIATLKDGSEVVYKIKSLDGGNKHYWEIQQQDKILETLNEYVNNLMKKMWYFVSH